MSAKKIFLQPEKFSVQPEKKIFSAYRVRRASLIIFGTFKRNCNMVEWGGGQGVGTVISAPCPPPKKSHTHFFNYIFLNINNDNKILSLGDRRVGDRSAHLIVPTPCPPPSCFANLRKTPKISNFNRCKATFPRSIPNFHETEKNLYKEFVG